MPLSSCRLKWFRNTAIRTCDFLPSLLFTDDRTVKATHSRVLQLTAGPTLDSEGAALAESRIKKTSLGEGGRAGVKPVEFSHSYSHAAAGWILHFNSGMSLT